MKNPNINEIVQDPTMQSARHAVYEKEREEITQIIEKIKEEYGLFYFYSGSCKFCDVFSPVVKMFAEKYKLDIIPVSLDGIPSKVFSNWQSDNGISKKFNVKNVPALFAVNPTNGHIVPISHGVSSIDQMEERIKHIVQFEKTHNQRGR
jgi:conjugal transfer pilus assembly protein TraF